MYLYTIRKDRSCMRFIRALIVLLQNIHTKGQYPNCDCMNAFIYSSLLISVHVVYLLPYLIHRLETCSLNFNSLSKVIPSKISLTLFVILKLLLRHTNLHALLLRSKRVLSGFALTTLFACFTA